MTTTGGAANAGVKMSIIRPVATERERLCAMVFNGPLLPAEAVMVLCGEDALPRVHIAAGIAKGVRDGVMLSGGIEDPPRVLGANSCHRALLGQGVASGRIMLDTKSQNTKEQAEWAVGYALEREWRHLLIVASAYHMPRATLTFVKSLADRDALEELRVIPLPASQTKWSETPDGVAETRMQLLHKEFRKIDEYQGKSDVATYRDGLDYLTWWERNG